MDSSLDRRIIRRIHVDRYYLGDEGPLFFALGLGGFPVGVALEALPARGGRLLAGVGENVNQFFLGLLGVDWAPIADENHAVLDEQLVGVLAKAGVEGLHFAGVGVI